MPPQTADSSAQAQQLMKAIATMLSGVGQATGATGGGGPAMIPGSNPPPPRPNINFSPQAGSPPIQTAPPRPNQPPQMAEQTGEQATKRGAMNAGMTSLGNSLSGMFSAIGQKEHAKKSALAENYLMQINGLLTSGDPNDKKKAEMILEDPKIRKILKTGLEYVPLEEEVPPEAQGVQSAIQKIQQKQQPQMRPIIPQANQEQQLKAAMTSALLQKLQKDPASAISMMGQSQLSSADQHAVEFYKSGLGIAPADMEKMTAAERMNGLKLFNRATIAAIKGEIDMYKAGVGYQGKVDSAKVFANARKFVASTAKSNVKGGKVNNYAAGAKIYEDYAKKYLDIVKSGKGPDGKPLSDEQKKQYEQKADAYQRQADEYLNQAGDSELMDLFMKSIEEEPDAADTDDDKPN